MAEMAMAEGAARGRIDYPELEASLRAVLAGETDRVARLASAACLIHHADARFLWTGFYLADPAKEGELVIGPYQGTLGCLRIPFGQGVCGTAAARRETVLVEDVHAFPGHIACDGRSASEIVVPLYDADGALAGVLDIDSDQKAAFTAADRNGLERLCALILAET